ncbi:MAG: efflux RND transporter periplasmic adaptor subunit [Pseudomonadota bacterium]|uniref:HlyD family secretion protein n=1 Tax=unclassified Phenylobacterium TaxID=2640670 RepID=UPI0006FCC5D9|nr:MULTISPECIES: efflux RND transporter periplasmic adaptor subunit [unclassified Phenylobacterium]KRB46672.1 hemolysin secretion protein D [Phenylobacterium sp. Root700]MBT9470396.1 efflux RND transporter periplasmic adaptor subunit [Phenylobacterium sp.]
MFEFIKSHRIKIATAAALVVLGGGAFAMASQAKAKKAEEAKIAAAAAPKSPFVAIANGKADVEGGMIQVAARRAGIVREVYVQEGDKVVKGQILARQEDDEPKLSAARAAAAVDQAKAQIALLQVQLSTAQREHQRLLDLVSTNFVAAQKVDQAADKIREAQANLQAQRASIATAQAALEEARYNLELTIIRAPSDGRIARRYANPGSGASTLNVSNMFDLEPTAPRIVRAEIAEGSLPHVAIGQTVQIAPESDPTKIYNGKVMRRAAVFGARKLQSDDPTERTDDRVVEVVVSADTAPFLIGQRVLVKFMRGGVQTLAAR